jgi:signal transduction histidine kinase
VTRRILAGFVAVLVAVLVAIVIPLGVVVSAQQRRDFRDAALGSARAVAALAEEQLDDRSTSGVLTSGVTRIAGAGDSVAVLNSGGIVIAQAGSPIPNSTIAAARAGRSLPGAHDRITVAATVGDSDRTVGLVVLTRDTAPLQRRQRLLWLALATAAIIALLVGALVAARLARWIARPLRSLIDAAYQVGGGDVAARADDTIGPAQVRDVAGAFNDMADRVAGLLEAQRGMTAEVSHQLRTPLAALRLRLELLGEELPEDQAQEVEAMIAETNRLGRLVDGLLAVARAEASPSAPASVDLGEIVTDRIAAWEPVADEREVSLSGSGGSVRAAATPGHVEQVLDNLIDNALEAAAPRGQITVRAGYRDGRALLIVADDGPGMSVDRMAHAFDRFVTDRAGNGGSGLGLTVVERLVASDGGTIDLRQTPGGGLTVDVSLPVTDPATAGQLSRARTDTMSAL